MTTGPNLNEPPADEPEVILASPPQGVPRWGVWFVWLSGLLLLLGVVLAYSQCLRSPFAYDDYYDVLENGTIRRLWPIWGMFHVAGKGFMTRPVTNLTFALDYAVSGPKPLMFHISNVVIHLATSFAYWGVLRRALVLPVFGTRFTRHRSTLALAAALLWALHPLNTEAVSYITQRYESLMALFVLLTFYLVIRSHTSARPEKWEFLGVLACLLALGCKEVAVSLPLLVLLFDRCFLAESFQAAWRRRRNFYFGLLLAWGCFAFIQTHAVPRAFAGFELTTPWWRYALNQPAVILHYLRLTVWPHPMVLDYYWPVVIAWRPLIPGLLVIGGLLAFSFWALVRKPHLAFLPIAFFAILAPTSSVMPILDLAVEHRMYLPLMAVILALVLGVHELWGKVDCWWPRAKSWIRLGMVVAFAMVVSVLGILTYLRNEDYRDPMDLWRSVIEAVPRNPRAHNNYAFNLDAVGLLAQANQEYAKTVELAPGNALFQSNYGLTLAKIGRYQEALEHIRIAVKLAPENSKYLNNLGFVLIMKGSIDNAAICFETALQVNPKDEQGYAGLSTVMQSKKNHLKAAEYIQKAIEGNPYNPIYLFQKSEILLDLGDVPGARTAFFQALRLEPSAEKMSNFAWSMHNRSMDSEAVLALRKAQEQRPDEVQTKIRLAWVLATSPDATVRNGGEAVKLCEQVLKSKPRTPETLDLLAVSLAEAGRYADATVVITEALSLARGAREALVPALEGHRQLFEQGKPFRGAPVPRMANSSVKEGRQSSE